MAKKTFRMPTAQQFYKRKVICTSKRKPIWVYLENEMLARRDVKPYNDKVGNWLKFLKELKCYNDRETKRAVRRLYNEIGPRWFFELSSGQRDILDNLKASIHKDILANQVSGVGKALSELGIILKYPKGLLKQVMEKSQEDPGSFMWYLYEAIYQESPRVLKKKYDMNAMIIMSSLVFIDLNECIQSLEDLTRTDVPRRRVAKKKIKKEKIPDVPFGVYLQKYRAPFYASKSLKRHPPPKPKPVRTKFKMRSDESYAALHQNMAFLDKRKKRSQSIAYQNTVCNYKFWEPPDGLHTNDPNKMALMEKLQMLKKRAKRKYNTPYLSTQCQIAGVACTGGRPNYILANTSRVNGKNYLINGGVVPVNGIRCTNILGHKGCHQDKDVCVKCSCLEKWGESAMKYVEKSKCKCKHLYDLQNAGRCKIKYFKPPNKHGPFRFDDAKIFNIDPLGDFVKECVENAVRSNEPTPASSDTQLAVDKIAPKKLLKTLLAELSNTPLIIPHLPQAYLLNNLLEWVRMRVRGHITPKQGERYKLASQRRWIQLNHIDFRARAYIIPFTIQQLKKMNFTYKRNIDKLINMTKQSFITRNRRKQLEQTRLLWATTKSDIYPGKRFMDTFFTYMPARMRDIFMINPFCAIRNTKLGKYCPGNR